MKPVLAFFLLLALLTQCGKKETTLAPNVANLTGTWQLTEPDSTYGVTLQIGFDTENPPHDVTPFLISGKSSVNQYNARFFAALDGMATVENLGSTKVAGPPQAMQFEQTYFDNLRTIARYELSTDNRLRLFHGGEKPGVLVYKRTN
ncbi:META domain-containing protein [Spirosoma sp. KNUC1025]|uniref:META domain-containing protein n=1 Tax=Spirosoma sp. KNUC1025 TaxID=2894082 RepID=UPI00386A7051|nr:META domain-containing protein [Spirosoma sp. KNUC1025]